ncbi:hypothetical protein ElyMa_000852900 [Elysia marginata]|uniref:Uncharacterized protein n=1 Tax=Elysia marginata TaxID=1093978 RepID=A0AAV4H0Y3_9GAST|nr:hypothetical protein ElyMa_000852900 [Elysia marginata]
MKARRSLSRTDEDGQVMYCTKTKMLSLEVAVQGKLERHRKPGRPNLEKESGDGGSSHGTVMGHLRTPAKSRVRWKAFVSALVANGKKDSKQVSN